MKRALLIVLSILMILSLTGCVRVPAYNVTGMESSAASPAPKLGAEAEAVPVTTAAPTPTDTPAPTEAPVWTPEPTPTPANTPAPTEIPAKEIVNSAFEKLDRVQSLRADVELNIDVEIAMAMGEMRENMPFTFRLDGGMDITRDPVMIRMEYASMDGRETTKGLMYIVPEGETVVGYRSVDDGVTWERETATLSDLPVGEIVSIFSAVDFQRAGTAEVNGKTALAFSAKAEGGRLWDMLRNAELMDSSLSMMPENTVEGLSDVGVTLMIDEESGLPVRYMVDMSDALKDLVEAALFGSIGEDLPEGLEIEVSVSNMVLDAVLSDFDGIEPIVIPEGALNPAGSGDAPAPGEGLANGRGPAKEAIVAAHEKLEQIGSLHTDILAEIQAQLILVVNDEEQERIPVDVRLTARADIIREPLVMEVEMSFTGLEGDGNVLMYVVREGETLALYISDDGGATWERTTDFGEAGLLEQDTDVGDVMVTGDAMEMELTDRAEVKGKSALVYFGRVRGEFLRELLNKGVAEGLEALGGEKVEGLFTEVRDVLLTVMVDEESGLPVRYIIDATEMLQDVGNGFLAQMLRSLGSDGVEIRVEVFRVNIDFTQSNFDGIESIEIPKAALSGTDPTTPAEDEVLPNDAQTPAEDADLPNDVQTPADYLAAEMEETVDDEGNPCVQIRFVLRPGDTATIVLPHQDYCVTENTNDFDIPYLVTIAKSCYFPNSPLSDPVLRVTPQILVTHADGTEESLRIDSFELHFPAVELELIEPAGAADAEAAVRAEEGNLIHIQGKVDDYTVHVTVNGRPVINIYADGCFEYTYVMTEDGPETVTVEAQKDNCVTASLTFTVTPY